MGEEDHPEVEVLAVLEEGGASCLDEGEVAYQGDLGFVYLALVGLMESLEGECPGRGREDPSHLEEVPFPMVVAGHPFPWEVEVA